MFFPRKIIAVTIICIIKIQFKLHSMKSGLNLHSDVIEIQAFKFELVLKMQLELAWACSKMTSSFQNETHSHFSSYKPCRYYIDRFRT